MAQVTQLVSGRAPEPMLSPWYHPVLMASKPSAGPASLPSLPSESCWYLTLNLLLCIVCLKLYPFLSLFSSQATTPLSDCVSFNSLLEQTAICLWLRMFVFLIGSQA